jgi:hypothetical protein
MVPRFDNELKWQRCSPSAGLMAVYKKSLKKINLRPSSIKRTNKVLRWLSHFEE